jgi:AmmeMemoRadiSam system protein B
MKGVRRSRYAGEWYPEDRAALRRLLDDVFRQSEQRTGALSGDGGRAFIVPHAAPEYSGTVAAAAYRCLAALRPECIVILGFAHAGLGAGILIPEADAYRTPLGEIAIDRAAREELLGCGPFAAGDPDDHSVEIQLPFLQFAVGEARVLPLYCGRLGHEERAEAAQALGQMIDSKTALVASSDFTHYGRAFGYLPFPVDAHTRERLRALDQRIIDGIGTFDLDVFHGALREAESTMCGYLAVGLLMEVMRASARRPEQKLLDYQTSGEITGDYAHSVSYAALAYGEATG